MTNPTKQYALGFNAYAFLKPKHLPEDALLEWVDDDDLKKLKPTPESMRDAILECKKHGLSARFSGGLALSISGDAAALHRCFGVRFVLDSNPALTKNEWFEDDSGTKLELAKPVAKHPLGGYIVNIVLVPGMELTHSPQRRPPPQYPGTNKPWDKQKPYHMWPHELNERMRFKGGPLDRKEQGYALNLQFYKKFCVSIVDTGLNGLHPYFRGHTGGKLSIPTYKTAPEPYPMHWPKVPDLTQANEAMSKEGLAAWTELNALLVWTYELPPQLQVGANGIGPIVSYDQSHQAVIFTAQNDPNFVQSRIVAQIKSIRASRFYIKYRIDNMGGTTPLSKLTKGIVGAGTGGKEFVLWEGNSALQYHADLNEMFTDFDNFLRERHRALSDALEWLDDYGGKHYDYNGHGTGMAASIFGVSRKAHVASFPALTNDEQRDYAGSVGSPNVDLASVFNHAADWAENKQFLRSNQSLDVIKEYRIISNSYSLPVTVSQNGQISQADMDYLVLWRNQIKDLVLRRGFSLLFSSGNSGAPQDPQVSLYALLGNTGAIIVGGAFDNVNNHNIPPRVRTIFLSNAAHGKVVPLPYVDAVNFDQNAKPIVLPDICGFVGPEISNQGSSPYVYIPSKGETWHYFGGGTSSACAQIAGLCGALRAKYDNLSPEQIKDAIVSGGDQLNDPPPPSAFGYPGRSYQRASPLDLNGVKLANILGAFHEASKMSPGVRN